MNLKCLVFKLASILILLVLPVVSYAQEKPEIFVQLCHTIGIFSAAFSPDGRYALSGSGDNTLKLDSSLRSE